MSVRGAVSPSIFAGRKVAIRSSSANSVSASSATRVADASGAGRTTAKSSPRSTYLSFLNSAPGAPLIEPVSEEVERWLEGKIPGGKGRFKPSAEPVLVTEGQKSWSVHILCRGFDDGYAYRLAMLETVDGSEENIFRTSITAFEPSDPEISGWLAVDVNNDRNQYCGTPKVARSLLKRVELYDATTQLSSRPLQITRPPSVDRLLEAMLDPRRRYPIIVATTAPGLKSARQFAAKLEDWTADVAGQGEVVILNAAMSNLFASRLPNWLHSPSYSIRTYLPQVDPRNLFDGQRHRILGARSLEQRSSAQIRGILTGSVRAAATSQTFPVIVDRVAHRLERGLRDDRLRRVARGDSHVTEPVIKHDSPAERALRDGQLGESVEEVSTTSLHYALENRILAALGVERLTQEVIDEVTARLADPLGGIEGVLDEVGKQDELVDAILSDVDYLENLLDERDDEVALLEDLLATAESENLEIERKTLYFQRELARSNPVAAYAERPKFEEVDSFYAILDRLESLENVLFTGDEDTVLALSAGDQLGTEAKTAWRAFVTLDEFARHYLSGGETRTLKEFIQSNPDGTSRIKPSKWAATESEQTMNQFGDTRVFPVPRSVDASGKAVMKAHFKLGQADTRAPRMHYLDDLARTGKFYVGYVGSHLPNTRTSRA